METNNKEIQVFAPATVSNVGCGFDIMGFALEEPGDEVLLRKCDVPEVRIIKITGDAGQLPANPVLNTAGKPVLSMLRDFKIEGGVEIEIHKKMPFGSGLGSSAASAVAAVYAMNKLFNLNLTKEQLLPYALEGEMIASGSLHADNVAPALYGGFILIRSYNPIDVIKIKVPDNLYCSVIHPDIKISTKEARELLPTQIPLKTAVKQWGNTAALIAGLMTNDFSLIGRAVEDFVAEPIRSQLIPYYKEVKNSALDGGAIGCSISGSGPSIFAFSDSFEQAEKISKLMQITFNNYGISSQTYNSKINTTGPKVLSVS